MGWYLWDSIGIGEEKEVLQMLQVQLNQHQPLKKKEEEEEQVMG